MRWEITRICTAKLGCCCNNSKVVQIPVRLTVQFNCIRQVRKKNCSAASVGHDHTLSDTPRMASGLPKSAEALRGKSL